MAGGFTNSFTSGEISDDAWDRTDIQPIAKGCEEATNYVVRIAGPLAKRRGFFRLGDAFDANHKGRLIPFRRSVDDALMLEFSHLTCRVWNNDGSPLISGGVQATFASPYSEADLAGLRYKQINDVIYLRNSAGLTPLTMTRIANDLWAFTVCTFPDGPWRPENLDKNFTLTVSGADEADANPATGAGSIPVGATVTLAASAALFDPAMIGAVFRFRETDGLAPVSGWKPGYHPPTTGVYNVSNGRVYRCDVRAVHDETVSNPPVQISGSQSDGGNTWTYVHDGAGIVRIDSVIDDQNATGTVTKTLPFRSDQPTPYWAEGAYSVFRGWPRMWPGLREERLIEGATAANLDFLDLTETAGFIRSEESFKPGLGTGAVVATDAVRRRVGDDSSELLWAAEASYPIIGTATGEHLLSGGLVDEGITPTTAKLKQISGYGSADVYPAKAHKALIHVTRGGQTLRELEVDAQQQAQSDDLTVLARHIADRGFAQLAWVPQPDEALWFRLNDLSDDGGLGVMTYHKEQQVRGFAGVHLPGGFICEDIAVLPGPGRLETLWGIFSRQKNGATQRHLWLQSAKTDNVFGMDCVEFYEGAPATTIAGLAHLEGEAVRILADGVELPQQIVTDAAIHLETPASLVYVGLPWKARFKSLKLDKQLGGSVNEFQRVTDVTVSLKTALARVGLEIDGVQQMLEVVSPRTAADVPASPAKRIIKNTTAAGDAVRDARLVIEDDSAYDGLIYSLRPKVTVANG